MDIEHGLFSPRRGAFLGSGDWCRQAEKNRVEQLQEEAPPKLDLLIARLQRPDGATIDELMKATAWQAHSVRGAMAGTLKKKGYSVTSAKTDGVRRYKLAEATDA